MTPPPICIAIVDDETSVRTALARLLKLAGYEVKQYASGDEFLVAVTVQPPDCVLLDVSMPGLSGIDVLSLLKVKAIELPVILITATDQADFMAQCPDMPELILKKPFTSDALLAAIDAAL